MKDFDRSFLIHWNPPSRLWDYLGPHEWMSTLTDDELLWLALFYYEVIKKETS